MIKKKKKNLFFYNLQMESILEYHALTIGKKKSNYIRITNYIFVLTYNINVT